MSFCSWTFMEFEFSDATRFFFDSSSIVDDANISFLCPQTSIAPYRLYNYLSACLYMLQIIEVFTQFSRLEI